LWDVCCANTLRTLPDVKARHARYQPAGLRVIGVHASGFRPSREADAVRAAAGELDIRYPVVIDVEFEIWQLYGNLGWPARYLFNDRGLLSYYHYGEGAYDETEMAIQELVGVSAQPLQALRPEDVPGARLTPPSDDVEGPYSGPYEAGSVWAVLDGTGSVTVNGATFTLARPGCYELISHPRSTAGTLELALGPGVQCHAVCFMPGLAA
jgi:hypothetical protein